MSIFESPNEDLIKACGVWLREFRRLQKMQNDLLSQFRDVQSKCAHPYVLEIKPAPRSVAEDDKGDEIRYCVHCGFMEVRGMVWMTDEKGRQYGVYAFEHTQDSTVVATASANDEEKTLKKFGLSEFYKVSRN